MNRPHVEILSFDGCPSARAARELVASVAAELELDSEIELLDVPDNEQAVRTRFLGSPTVRIGGRDIEPGADSRTDYVLSCRLYRSDTGLSGLPRREWIVEAFSR